HGGNWEYFKSGGGKFEALHVQAFAAAKDGALWVGTDQGLIRIDPKGNWQNFTKKDGMPATLVFGLAIDADGTVWAATGDGLLRLRETIQMGTSKLEWTLFGTMDGPLPSPLSTSVVSARAGTVRVGTEEYSVVER